MHAWLFILLCLIFSTSAMAGHSVGPEKDLKQVIQNSCKNVRIDQNNPAMGTMIETRQIGGTCYAHAATTLYDAYRLRYPLKGQKTIQPSSPASVASIYKKYLKEDQSLGSGSESDALTALQTDPPCQLARMQNESPMRSYIDEQDLRAYYLENNISILKKQKLHLRVAADSNMVKEQFNAACAAVKVANLEVSLKTKNFKEITKVIENTSAVQILNEIDYFDCDVKNTANPYDVYVMDLKSSSTINFYELIIKKLNENPNNAMPLGVGFCSSQAYGLSTTECGSHAAVIIGQRINPDTKACEFLVQDSGLPANYDTPYAKHPDTKSQKVWINALALMRNTKTVTYLQPKDK